MLLFASLLFISSSLSDLPPKLNQLTNVLLKYSTTFFEKYYTTPTVLLLQEWNIALVANFVAWLL